MSADSLRLACSQLACCTSSHTNQNFYRGGKTVLSSCSLRVSTFSWQRVRFDTGTRYPTATPSDFAASLLKSLSSAGLFFAPYGNLDRFVLGPSIIKSVCPVGAKAACYFLRFCHLSGTQYRHPVRTHSLTPQSSGDRYPKFCNLSWQYTCCTEHISGGGLHHQCITCCKALTTLKCPPRANQALDPASILAFKS